MKEQELIKKSIAHWKRMLHWADQQFPLECPTQRKMFDAIGENWNGQYCSLCLEYFRFTIDDSGDCTDCPLFEAGHGCEYGGPWREVHWAATWSEWLEAAQKMIKTLEELK